MVVLPAAVTRKEGFFFFDVTRSWSDECERVCVKKNLTLFWEQTEETMVDTVTNLPIPLLVGVTAFFCCLVGKLSFVFTTVSGKLNGDPRGLPKQDSNSYSKTDRTEDVHLLCCIDSETDVNERAWDILSASSHPERVFICFLRVCSKMGEVEVRIDSFMRDTLDVQVWTKGIDILKNSRRCKRKLCKAFLNGEENLVVIMHRECSLRKGWDTISLSQMRKAQNFYGVPSSRIVMTSPCRQTEGRCHFPCLSPSGRREPSVPYTRPFHCPPMPSVCVCDEIVMGTNSSLSLLLDKGSASSSSSPLYLLSLTQAVLTDDIELEKRCVQMFQADEKSSVPESIMLRQTVGLSATSTCPEKHAEENAKYGSYQAAMLATRLGYSAVSSEGGV